MRILDETKMALFEIDLKTKTMAKVEPTTFTAQKIKEPRDLRPLLRDNLAKINPHWFLLSEEFSGWEGSNRAIDLLALVRDGDEAHIVVIELKRTEDGGHMDMQAVRYAAMIAPFSFDEVVQLHADYRLRRKKAPEGARAAILEHLHAESAGTISISNRPQIVLVSWGFSREISATVLWLNSMGLDIRCFALKPYEMGNALFLDVDQVIPVPLAQNYEFSLRNKQIQQEDAVRRSRSSGSRTVPGLDNAGILNIGMKVRIIKPPIGAVTEKESTATYQGKALRSNFKWCEDDKLYSLSELTAKLYNKYENRELDATFPGPDYWAIEGDNESLYRRFLSVGSLPGTVIP